MTVHELPAHLRGAAVPDFTDYASDGLGTALPPHVSIAGNTFTLIDATGQEYPSQPTLDVVIVDRSNVACKMYFDKPYTPGQDSGEPPACFSTNGIGPSRDAANPQARTCAECAHNVRGSAQSKLSGAMIKACRDEYHLAILAPAIPSILFRYVLTPGSFKNWQAYVEKFKNTNLRISMVVTRLSFTPKVNGEIQFTSVSYADEATYALVTKALAEKATDVLVGRLDTPRTAIAGPAQTAQIAAPTEQVQQPGPFGATLAPNVGDPGQAQPNPAQPAATTSPSEPAPAQRRRRRTAAEMAEANAAPANGQASLQPAAAPTAPFPHAGQTAQAGSFGIAQGQPAAANPELTGMLDDFFAKV